MSRVTIPFVFAIFAAFLLSIVSADVALPPWSWDQYIGSTQWRTSVSEDDSGCNGGVITTTQSVIVDFNKGHAQIGDWGHGVFSGLLQNGNTLHIPGQTISDGSGNSRIYPYDVIFTSDCLTFTTTYRWDYSDAYQLCSGSTTLNGRIVNGCPAPTNTVPIISTQEQTTEEKVADARSDLNQDLDLYKEITISKLVYYLLIHDQSTKDFQKKQDDIKAVIKEKQDKINELEPKIEAKYKAILDKDPNNFEANLDMAELKRSQGLPHEYYEYMDRALSSGRVTESMKEAVEKNIAKELGFSKFPKPQNSLLMKRLSNEGANWQGTIYGKDVQEESADKSTWRFRLFTIFAPENKVVNDVVFK